MHVLRGFPVARFRFVFRAVTAIFLPPYKGSALRGAFGHAFRSVTCPLPRRECGACLLRARCAYLQVFETPVDPTWQDRGINTHAPHPFVLEPPLENRTTYAPGDVLTAGLVLIGRAIDLLPYFIYAFEVMGQKGLGQGRGKAELREVWCHDELLYDSECRTLREIPAPLMGRDGPALSKACPERSRRVEGGERVTLEFLTPLRLKVRNHLTDSPTFLDIVEALISRARALARYHAPERAAGLDGDEAIAAAREARVLAFELRWVDWERYSTRQETRMKMGGVVGRMEVEGADEVLRPWLALGEMIHVGKGTSFGLGRYMIGNSPRPVERLAGGIQ